MDQGWDDHAVAPSLWSMHMDTSRSLLMRDALALNHKPCQPLSDQQFLSGRCHRCSCRP